MYSLLIAAVASFFVALLLTPVFRKIACHWRILDGPDSGRKCQTSAVPRIGGLPIFIAYLAAFALLLLLGLQAGEIIRRNVDLAWRLAPAAALIFVTGLLDDLYDLKPGQKLLGQTAAALAAFAGGIHLTNIAGFHLGIWWALPATVIWLIGSCNAFNLIDGIDGLAAGIGLFATVTILIAALLMFNMPLALATAPLAGALLGFLWYNSNPATVYLGDSGSLLIGFLLGCYSIVWSEKSVTVVGMTAPLMVLAVPLLDTALAIIRRYLRNKPVFGADRGHIHHRLLARGFSPRRVVFMIYGVSGIGACLSILQSVFHERFGKGIILIFCAAVGLGIRYLGYAEFDEARRLVFSGNFRKALNAKLQLVTLRDALKTASTPDECWDVVRQTCQAFSLTEIILCIQGRTYSQAPDNLPASGSWTLRIELSDTEYINFSRASNESAFPITSAFVDTFGSILRAKVRELRGVPLAHAHEVPFAPFHVLRKIQPE